jgi:hypothetical protein
LFNLISVVISVTIFHLKAKRPFVDLFALVK